MKYYIKKYKEPSGQLSPEYLLYLKNKNYPTFTNQGELKEKETALDGTWFGNLFDKAYNYSNKNYNNLSGTFARAIDGTRNLYDDVQEGGLSFVPGISDAVDVVSIGDDVNKGNYGSAALTAGLMILPGSAGKIKESANYVFKNIPNFTTKIIRSGKLLLKYPIVTGGLKLANTFEYFTPSKGDKIIAKRLNDLYLRDRLIDENLDFGPNSNILVHGDPAATGVYRTSSGIGKNIATVENYPYFKNGELHPTKDKYHDYRSSVQNLIFWGDGMPFFETRGKLFQNILDLLQKPSDYKYFSTTNKEKLMSNAQDFPTENPYRFIITEKPKNVTIRNSLGVSRDGVEIVTGNIPIDMLRGFEYDPLTKTFNRVLYHSYKKGGPIHIKEKNKGKFTESAKRAGKSVQEHARDVVNNPKATKLQKKRALFALNAKKFKH